MENSADRKDKTWEEKEDINKQHLTLPKNIPIFPSTTAGQVQQESLHSLGTTLDDVEDMYSNIKEARFVGGENEGESSDTGSFVSAYSDTNNDANEQRLLNSMDEFRLTPETNMFLTIAQSTGDIGARKERQDSVGSLIGSPFLSSLDVADRLNFDTFDQWCYSFVSLNFDLEIGQNIEFIYPPRMDMLEQDRCNIRFSSFPDTSSNVGDTVFSYRFPLATDPTQYMHGYVFFRQQKDDTIRRGYLQKSLCLLSKLPFPGLFLRIVAMMGPVLMDAQKSSAVGSQQNNSRMVLEAACHSISQWPFPAKGVLLELPFLGAVLRVEMPNDEVKTGRRAQLLATSTFMSVARKNESASSSSKSTPLLRRNSTHTGEQILPTIPCTLIYPTGFMPSPPSELQCEIDCDIPLFSTNGNVDLPGTSLGLLYRFFDNLDMLWTIWELILLGEPLVIIGKSQAVVSEAVWWISELIRPIPFSGDFRPYFTIQDSDFHRFTGSFKKQENSSANTSNASSFYQLTNNTTSASLPRGASSPNISRTNLSRPSTAPHSPNRASAPGSNNASGMYLTTKNLSDASFKGRFHSPLKTENNGPDMISRKDFFSESRSVVLGVTNPFFTKALEGWPHTLRLSSGPVSNIAASSTPMHRVGSSCSMSSVSSLMKPKPSSTWMKLKNTSSKSLLEAAPGLTTSHKPFIAKDKKLIRSLQEAFEASTKIPVSVSKESRLQALFSGNSQDTASIISDGLQNIVPIATSPTTTKRYKAYALNEILRRHFVDLTERFLVPLNRYFALLIPSQIQLSSSDLPCVVTHENIRIVYHPPHSLIQFKVRPFDMHAFLLQLQSYGPPRLAFNISPSSSKSSWIDMYIRFIESPNFIGWLREKRRVAEYQVRILYLEQLRNETAMNDLELFLLLRRELVWLNSDPVKNKDRASNENFNSFMNNLKNAVKPELTFLVAPLDIRMEFEVKSKMLWAKFSPEIRSAFKQGLFDQHLCEIPSDEDDFIVVL